MSGLLRHSLSLMVSVHTILVAVCIVCFQLMRLYFGQFITFFEKNKTYG